MKEQLQKRLESLEAEYKKGEERLHTLEQEAATVRTSMLRISGAVQVLREELGLSQEKTATPIIE